tara:strand:+ start:269 stop:949 length:681 start_codon:yes stop_codon:yes gene_type:complete
MARTKLHGHNYVLKDGTRAQSVTTIIGQNLGWNKQALLAWTKRMAIMGEDPDLVMRDAGDIGTLVHIMIQNHMQNRDTETGDFTRNQTEKAMVAFTGYLNWYDKKKFEPIITKTGQAACEISIVNEELRTGGTIDCIGKMNDELLVVDWKTTKGTTVYPEMVIQLGAYTYMIEQAKPNAKIDRGMIMRFDKESGKFHQHMISRQLLDVGSQIFKHLCKISQLKKLL